MSRGRRSVHKEKKKNHIGGGKHSALNQLAILEKLQRKKTDARKQKGRKRRNPELPRGNVPKRSTRNKIKPNDRPEDGSETGTVAKEGRLTGRRGTWFALHAKTPCRATNQKGQMTRITSKGRKVQGGGFEQKRGRLKGRKKRSARGNSTRGSK